MSSSDGSIFYQDSKNSSELARDELRPGLSELTELTTSITPKEIWESLNQRCIEKFGDAEGVKRNVKINDNEIVRTILSVETCLRKINDFPGKLILKNKVMWNKKQNQR